MQIIVLRDGKEWGPFSQEELRQYISTGNFQREDLAWHSGMAKWESLSSVLGLPALPPPAVARALPSPAVVTVADLRAHNQSMLLYESRKKSPGLACVLNIFFPGIGYAYAGRPIYGICLYLFCIVCAFLSFLILPGILVLIIWISGIFGAYQMVEKNNRRLADGIVVGGDVDQPTSHSFLRPLLIIGIAVLSAIILTFGVAAWSSSH